MKIIRIAAMVLLFSMFTVCSFANQQQYCDVTPSKSLVENQIQDDGWVEVGKITMKCAKGFRCGDAARYPADLEGTLYVKELGYGSIIYRVEYDYSYYAVSTEVLENGKILCSVTIDYYERYDCVGHYKLRWEFYL